MQALPKGDTFMLISSKGRYTLYVLVDLAKNGQNRYIPLKEIAERQNISKKYMEGILKTMPPSGTERNPVRNKANHSPPFWGGAGGEAPSYALWSALHISFSLRVE